MACNTHKVNDQRKVDEISPLHPALVIPHLQPRKQFCSFDG
jgi:hypothetical protein